MIKEKEHVFEINLPTYLANDLYAVKNNNKKNCSYYDCLINELYSSINIAVYAEEITEEQAWYLRQKYIY